MERMKTNLTGEGIASEPRSGKARRLHPAKGSVINPDAPSPVRTTDRCQSGRMDPVANRASLETGSEGSNPSLSAMQYDPLSDAALDAACWQIIADRYERTLHYAGRRFREEGLIFEALECERALREASPTATAEPLLAERDKGQEPGSHAGPATEGAGDGDQG